MSQHRIKKYVESPLHYTSRIRSKPILISDSKGNYIKSHSDLIEDFGYSIDFVCRGGATFKDQYHWLERNLEKKVQYYGKIILYVWLGTCDLTSRQGKYIDLRHNDDGTSLAYLRCQIDRYLTFVSNFPSVKIVFLEIPPYSIQTWNACKGHKNPYSFHSQDLVLSERISIVNEYIRSVNEYSGVTSPKFRLDLLRYRKANRENSFKRTSLNFSNYNDGIHPNNLLARCWMKRIVAQIFRDCL